VRFNGGRRASPPVIALVTLALLFGTTFLLGLSAATGSRQSGLLVTSVPWLVWKVVGAVAVVVFTVLFGFAIRILARAGDWGLTAPTGRTRGYLASAVLVVAAIAVLILINGSSPAIPVAGLIVRTRAVLAAGLVMSIPWLALVWLAQAECHDLERRTADPGQPEPGAASGRLLQLWRLLVTCVTAFAIAVVAAIVNSGALRASFLQAHPHRGTDFPPANVLFYGAFFAVVLSVITVPLVAAWRSCAFAVVERTHPLPPDGQPTEDWMSARARLEKLLHLDVPLLRNPLTALSVFVPLITAALAAFIPQLGMS
jgi:hypothetical protein